MSILTYLCEHGLCAYTRKHNCFRQTNQDIFVREHNVDEDIFGCEYIETSGEWRDADCVIEMVDKWYEQDKKEWEEYCKESEK